MTDAVRERVTERNAQRFAGTASQAFAESIELIRSHAATPHDDPDSDFVDLVRAIDKAYGVTPSGPRRAPRTVAEAKERIEQAADRIIKVMPHWFPKHPRWMTACALTATAGTLATVAVASGPIGLAAGFWPLYTAAGAALGELGGRSADNMKPAPLPRPISADRIRSALLHTLMLELQGRPNEQTNRVLDAVLADLPDSPASETIDAAATRLSGLLAEEPD